MKRLLSHNVVKRESLADLCNDAFVLSKEAVHEVCWEALRFEAASVSATWQTRAGGTAVLKNQIMRLGNHVLRPSRTSLELFERPGTNVFELHKYLFTAAAPDDLKVYKICLPVPDAIHDDRLDQRHLHDIELQLKESHADTPTPEDLNLLYDELARGASGRYTPDSLALERL